VKIGVALHRLCLHATNGPKKVLHTIDGIEPVVTGSLESMLATLFYVLFLYLITI